MKSEITAGGSKKPPVFICSKPDFRLFLRKRIALLQIFSVKINNKAAFFSLPQRLFYLLFH